MTRHGYARKVFLHYLRIFARYKEKTREGRGIEPLHHIRTTTRRLRNALWVFKEILSVKELKRWRRNFRQLAKVTSAARDLDIQIQFLSGIKHRFSREEYRPVIENLRQRLKIRRRSLQPRIARSLDQVRQSRTVEQLKIFLKHSSRSSGEETVYLRHLAQKRIGKRLKKVFYYESYADHPEAVDELHQLRIAAKHLRYTLENFEGLYEKPVAPFIDSVRSIQSVLGELHDYDVWIATLPRYRRKNGSHQVWNEALDHLQTECKKARDDTYRKFHYLWNDLKKQKAWEGLIDFVGDRNENL